MNDEFFMREALSLACSVECLGEVPRWRHRRARGADSPGAVSMRPSVKAILMAHAEIASCGMRPVISANHRLPGSPCVTLEPQRCAGVILHARIARLPFYGARDPKNGCTGRSVVDLFAVDRLNHHTEVLGGILAGECGDMLSAFFAEARRKARTQVKVEISIPAQALRLLDDEGNELPDMAWYRRPPMVPEISGSILHAARPPCHSRQDRRRAAGKHGIRPTTADGRTLFVSIWRKPALRGTGS